MGTRAAVAAGLLAGAITGVAVLGGALALLPSPGAPVPTAAPTDGAPSGSATPAATVAASVPGGDGAFGVGEPAPALRVPQLGGGEIDLAMLRGQPVWVNFMATWCGPCRDELPLMTSFALRYSSADLVVLAIDVREDESAVDAFVREVGVAFPVGLDADGAAQQAWGAFALPVHFWIDADGIVRDGALGGIGPDIMAAGLEAILPGVEVAP